MTIVSSASLATFGPYYVFVGGLGRRLVGRQEISIFVEGDETDVMDGLTGPREENIENRQRAVDLSSAELGLHILGNEEGQVQNRTKRTFQISQRLIDAAARQAGQLRNVTHRLKTGHDVS